MKLRLNAYLAFIGIAAAVLTSCGQAPAFLNQGEADSRVAASGQGIDGNVEANADATAAVPTTDVNGDGVIDDKDVIPAASVNPNTDAPPADPTGNSGAGSTTAGNPPTPPAAVYPTVPGASTDDVVVLNKCMEKWKTLPWTGTVPNFRKIYASVNIGGSGTTINETTRTAQPELVLIYAGVNVGGSTSWNLMNPNAYYCMKVNVNVQTQFAINLHCNSRLSDNSVQVNVGGSSNGSTSNVGINVLSTVTVNNITPAGDQCIR